MPETISAYFTQTTPSPKDYEDCVGLRINRRHGRDYRRSIIGKNTPLESKGFNQVPITNLDATLSVDDRLRLEVRSAPAQPSCARRLWEV